jgi:hypothetical protein
LSADAPEVPESARSSWLLEAENQRVLAGSLAFIILGGAGFLVWKYHSFIDPNYLLAASIGLAVGATEMMARYRDAPFAPLFSVPGLFYAAINAGAASLAYHLILSLEIEFSSPIFRVLTAGLSAMAFFRSGLFTVRLGDSDVAVGPNLILQILLQALDRAYDRDRATPRSINTVQIMSGISFAQAKNALPSICFNLMQNVADSEREALRNEVDALDGQTDISDEGKSLILGLALMNIVGYKTLRAAVNALGTTVQESKPIDRSLLIEMARVEPKAIVANLPLVCNNLCHPSIRLANPQKSLAEIQALDIGDESKAVMTLYKLVQSYGQSTVSLALSTMLPN